MSFIVGISGADRRRFNLFQSLEAFWKASFQRFLKARRSCSFSVPKERQSSVWLVSDEPSKQLKIIKKSFKDFQQKAAFVLTLTNITTTFCSWQALRQHIHAVLEISGTYSPQVMIQESLA
jgi:hypothetical protein